MLTQNSILEFSLALHTIHGLESSRMELQGFLYYYKLNHLNRTGRRPEMCKWEINKKKNAEGMRRVNGISIKKISILMGMGMMHIVTIVKGKYKNIIFFNYFFSFHQFTFFIFIFNMIKKKIIFIFYLTKVGDCLVKYLGTFSNLFLCQ